MSPSYLGEHQSNSSRTLGRSPSTRHLDLRDPDPARLDRRRSTPRLPRRPCDRTAPPDGSISFRSLSTA